MTRVMFTDEEKSIIKAGWAQATTDKQALGMDIFMTMFEMYPKHKLLFKEYKSKSRAELERMPKMKAHALRVVNALDGPIQTLDDMDVCSSLLEQIGQSHKQRNMSVHHFEDLNKVIVVVFQRRLGKAFTDNKAIWVKLLQHVISEIQRGL